MRLPFFFFVKSLSMLFMSTTTATTLNEQTQNIHKRNEQGKRAQLQYSLLQSFFVRFDLNNPYKTNKQTKRMNWTTCDHVHAACKERGSKCFIICHSPITYVAIYLDKTANVYHALSGMRFHVIRNFDRLCAHLSLSSSLLFCFHLFRLLFNSMNIGSDTETPIEIASKIQSYLIKKNQFMGCRGDIVKSFVQ